MKNQLFIIGSVLLLAIAGYLVFSNNTNNNDSNKNRTQDISYREVSSEELSYMLENKDFKLLDVHTPEQRHIPKTDLIVSYNKIDEIIANLPDKKEKIVIYCRSGSMSQIVAEELADRGYANVFSLTGGLNGWIARGEDTLPQGYLN